MNAAVDLSLVASALTVPAPDAAESFRHTTPALSSVDPTTDVPSARPTSVPDFDMEALASACVASRRGAMPMDLFVPVRTAAVSETLDFRAAFLLLHVDGRSSIAQIAYSAQLPVEEVVSSFFYLVAMGVVEMTATSDRAPESGVQRRTPRPETDAP